MSRGDYTGNIRTWDVGEVEVTVRGERMRENIKGRLHGARCVEGSCHTPIRRCTRGGAEYRTPEVARAPDGKDWP